MRFPGPAAVKFGVWLLLWTLVLSGRSGSVGAATSQPVPFQDAYRDGFVWVAWGNLSAPQMDRILDRVAATGARHIVVPYFGCQTSTTSADVGSCEVRMRNAPVKLARAAQAHGFEVSYLPIVQTLDWQWRGYFEPKDVEGWFRTYTAWIRGVAREAASLGMKELVVASEFTRLYRYNEHWKQVLREVRRDFSGPLVVAVNWGDLDHSFWSEADAIGISSYYPLGTQQDPLQVELDQAWAARRAEFVQLSEKWSRPIHITEVGYHSTTDAARTPWEPRPSATADPALQARCFEAFRRAFGTEPRLARANVWATEGLPADPSGLDRGFEMLGKPAEAVLREFFRQRALMVGDLR